MPLPDNHTLATVFGTIGTICWTGQMLPQLWKTWREKDTHGLSSLLPFLWGVSGVPLGAYAFIRGLGTPLLVQPQLFMVLCLSSWAQCLYYTHNPKYAKKKGTTDLSVSNATTLMDDSPANLDQGIKAAKPAKKTSRWMPWNGFRWTKWRTFGMLVVFLVLLAALEIGLIFAVKPSYDRGTHAPATFLGILSSVIIAAGFVPQYIEIWRLRRVTGLSLPFIAIDCAGGIFNDLALVWAGGSFDVLAGTCYTIVVVMDLVVVFAAVILNPRAIRRDKAAVEQRDVEKAVANGNIDAQRQQVMGMEMVVPEGVGHGGQPVHTEHPSS